MRGVFLESYYSDRFGNLLAKLPGSILPKDVRFILEHDSERRGKRGPMRGGKRGGGPTVHSSLVL